MWPIFRRIVAIPHKESTGEWNHCNVDIKAILKQVGKQTVQVRAFHNHIDGNRNMSDEDRDVTERLRTALSAYGVSLTHEIIPGDLDLQESQQRVTASSGLVTQWDMVQAKDARLWKSYGGRRPF